MNYQIIKDEQKLRTFIEWLPELQEYEQYYLCLFARSKYAKDAIVHIKSDKAQLKRVTSKKKNLFDKIRQMECEIGAYHQREVEIPQEALALYITVNPRDLWRATFNSLVHLAKCIQTNAKTMNPHQEVMSEIQKSCSNKYYLDIDIDNKNPKIIKQICEYINSDCLTILQSRGGYHVLVRFDAINEQFKKTWYNKIVNLPDVDQRGDNMIPVPGCTQGDFVPSFIPVDYFLDSIR